MSDTEYDILYDIDNGYYTNEELRYFEVIVNSEDRFLHTFLDIGILR